jgi:hypothetical protein
VPVSIIPSKIEIEFTDEGITASAGSVFLCAMAKKLQLREQLKESMKLKKRARGATDAEMILSLIYSLAQGDGALLDVDRLGHDQTRRELLGLETVPNHRRLGEYLMRFDEAACEQLQRIACIQASRVIDTVIAHEAQSKGYVPVFVDGTGLEVTGEYFEGAGKLYDGSNGYWLHAAFVGGLWVTQRLQQGGGHVASGVKELLGETAGMLGRCHPVWARFDNAYYRKEVVDFCNKEGWDYSISVTSETYKRPLREMVSDFIEEDWEAINDDGTEHAAYIYHKPGGWKREQAYVVVRSMYQGSQKLLYPRYTFILASRDDLPLAEIVKRHRGKQGQENALKGPLIHLDLHHPPSGNFNANRAFYSAGQIAHILLVALQMQLLPKEARAHGIRTIIRDLVRVAGKLVRHARKWKLLFSKSALKLHWISHAADCLPSYG